jgi:hypothetical protein
VTVNLLVVAELTHTRCHLGGVVISVFATGPKGRRFKPGLDDGF